MALTPSRVRRFGVLALVIAAGLTAGVSSQAPQSPQRVLISFRQAVSAADRTLVTSAGGRITRQFGIVSAVAADLPPAAMAALANHPRVAFIEPDYEITTSDAELDTTWSVKMIGAGEAHVDTPPVLGAGIKVAVIDSGIDYAHADLAANYGGGYDFLNNDADPMDDCGHGTHVAGTVGAVKNGAGVVGVAPSVKLYALKFLGPAPGNRCSGATSGAIAAIDWAVQQGIHITNNSWGGGGSVTLDNAFANASALGMLHIAAAMNTGTCTSTNDLVGSPARYRSVVAVAATDVNDARACFSSTGPDLEISAPGVQIMSTTRNNNYGGNWNGTSMASPHVAGTAALLMSHGFRDWNLNGRINDDVRNALAASALDLGAAGRDVLFGFGRVRVPEALEAYAAAAPLTVRVDTIDFVVSGGGKNRNKDLTVNLGTTYGLAAPVDATVDFTLLLNDAFYATGSASSGHNGLASVLFRNTPAGTYRVVVTGASASGLTWDTVTPANSITK